MIMTTILGMNVLVFVLSTSAAVIALWVLAGQAAHLIRDYADGHEFLHKDKHEKTEGKHRRIRPLFRTLHVGSPGVFYDR